MHGFGGEGSFVGLVLLQMAQSVKQPDSEGGTGTQTGARRQIAGVVDFNAVLDAEILEAGSYGRMLDVSVILDRFDLRPDDAGFFVVERWKKARRDVTEFVYGSGEDGAAVIGIPTVIISAAAEERYAVWSAGYYNVDFSIRGVIQNLVINFP